MAQFDQSHHKQAFEIWYDTRNWSTVAKKIGMDWSTSKRWAAADYNCKDNCPWHNWDMLMQERDRALAARDILLLDGVTDPLEHERVMKDAIAANTTLQVQKATMDIVRSDTERLQLWEYLFSKIYFDATGIPVDWRVFRSLEPGANLEENVKLVEALRRGMHCTSFEQCIRTLKVCQEQIDALRGRTIKQEQKKEEEVEPNSISIDELRRMQHLVDSTPPDKLRGMLTQERDVG
jgi:hypothetical protein